MSHDWARNRLWLAIGLFSVPVSTAHASNPPGLPPACETSAIVSLRVAAYRGPAAPGVAEDQYRLARAIEAAAHRCSEGVADGIREAIGWYETAGAKGHAEAAYRAGQHCADGNGGEESQIAALWFYMAAQRGHVGAQAKLGMCYLKGTGVQRDLLAAAHWLGKAAVQTIATRTPR
jgi:TPR repeat protein